MNHTLEAQTAHVHGRVRDEHEFASDQLKTRNARLSEVEVSACSVNNGGQRYRAKCFGIIEAGS